MKIAWHISHLIPFSTIHNISISVKRSNFTLVFFNAFCHANLGSEFNFTFRFNIIVTPNFDYSYWSVVTFFMFGKVSNISYNSIFNRFILFVQPDTISYIFDYCSVIYFFFWVLKDFVHLIYLVFSNPWTFHHFTMWKKINWFKKKQQKKPCYATTKRVWKYHLYCN